MSIIFLMTYTDGLKVDILRLDVCQIHQIHHLR